MYIQTEELFTLNI